MNLSFLVCVLALSFTTLTIGANIKKDVCIVGGGAAGMSMAVMLKDLDYSVMVFERLSQVGGHCDTFYVNVSGVLHHVDFGVQACFNSTRLIELGSVGWHYNSDQFMSRFTTLGAGPNVAQVFDINLETGEPVTVPFDPYAFFNALTRWQTFLSNYTWSDAVIDFEDVPPELTTPFLDTYLELELEPMAFLFRIFGYNSGIGLGNYSGITTYEMVTGLSKACLNLALDPFGGFGFVNGCQDMYVGMSSYIGEENIIVNADVTEIKRKKKSNKRIKIKGMVDETEFKYKCNKLVVAFPPLLSNLDFMDLDSLETEVFENVKEYYYWNGVVQVEGPLVSEGTWQIQNADASSVFFAPFSSGPTIIARNDPDIPFAQTQASTLTLLSANDVNEISREWFDNISSDLLTNVTRVVGYRRHGGYDPHVEADVLAESPSIYRRLEDLQGHKGTFWTSAFGVIPSTTHVQNNNARLVGLYF